MIVRFLWVPWRFWCSGRRTRLLASRLPWLAQIGYGLSPISSALCLAGLGAAFGVTSLFAGRLARRGVRRTLIIGVVVDLAGMLLALVTCWLSAPLEPVYLLPS